MSSSERKIKANWTFPVSQIEEVEDIAERQGYDSSSQLVREWLAEKIDDWSQSG